ncbi:MAG TPA: DUF5666 domain-containing protein [Ktedonobacterales bacterium]
MSRSIARIMVIAIVCLSVALLAGKTMAAARGDSPVWTTSGPGAATSQSGPDAGSPTSTPPNGQIGQNADNPTNTPPNGQNGQNAGSPTNTPPNGQNATQDVEQNEATEAPGSEGSEAGEQNANEAGEQEMVGSVASINADGSAFTLKTATGAVVIDVTNQTEFEDGLMGVSSLHQGMNVRVDGAPQAGGHVLADKVKAPSDNGAPEQSNDSGQENHD